MLREEYGNVLGGSRKNMKGKGEGHGLEEESDKVEKGAEMRVVRALEKVQERRGVL